MGSATLFVQRVFINLIVHYSATAMTFEPASNLLAFVLPLSFRKGDLTFSRSSNNREEIHIPVAPDTKPRHVVSTAQLSRGIWRVRLNWSDGRQQYHDEKEISIG